MEPGDKPAGATPTAPDPTLVDLTGRTVGDFQVLRRLGQGGMGQVFLAEQISLKRKVALKLLRSDLACDRNALERFKKEATAIAGVTHANIVQVYLIGETEGLHYMALEYVEGRNLREYLERKGPPDLMLALSILRQVAAALARAGELGLVHRDIKPDNILLTRKGEVKVADFGLAKALGGERQPLNLTQSGVVMGTPLYMSPEQVSGKPIDCRSDLYSLGCTCYHMLTGQPPFRGPTPIEVAMQQLQKEAPPLGTVRPDLPAPLAAIVQKLMAKAPADRYQTARDLLRDVVRLRDSLSAGATAAMGPPGDPAGVSVELFPVADSAPATGAPGALTLTIPAAWRRYLLPAALAGSLLLALGVGAAIALGRRGADRPVSRPSDDVKQVEALLSGKDKREQALREAVEQYLNPPAGTNVNHRAGYELCLDLGLFYFEERRLDDAGKFFARLEAIRQAPQYQYLGKTGRAIVLALQSKAKESNALLRELAPFPNREVGEKKLEKKARVDPNLAVWFNQRLRFWLAEALHYNARNGIPDDEVPFALRQLRQRSAAAADRK